MSQTVQTESASMHCYNYTSRFSWTVMGGGRGGEGERVGVGGGGGEGRKGGGGEALRQNSNVKCPKALW